MTIMKKIYRFMMAAIAATAAMTACQQENLEPEGPNAEGVKFMITADIQSATKAVMSDSQTMTWQETDKATAWSISSNGEYGYNGYSERNVQVSSIVDGNAVFEFSTLPQGGKTWIAVNSNSDYDGCNASKVEFQYAAEIVQASAGVLNPAIVNLISDEITVPVAEAGEKVEIDVDMNIVGSIMRFLVYSASGTYADEKVQSVELISADNNIAGGKACMAYNFVKDGKYVHSDTEVGDECFLYWNSTSKSIKTTLTEPLSLEGLTEATQGTGIYMAVPPVKVGGYTYVVTTDLAKYTFDASSKDVTFAENTLKNVMLNLENKNVKRIELASIKGDLQYIGDLNAASNKISYKGCTAKDVGYWYAQIRDTGGNWVNKEGVDNWAYYENVKFEIIDDATGDVADWLTVQYTQGSTHWYLTVEPQPEGGAERTATITAIFSDVDGYIITEQCKTKVVKVTQGAYTNVNILGFYGGIGDQVISGSGVNKQSLGYCVITVNGVFAESWGDDKNNEQVLYSNVVIECRDGAANGPIVDWLTVEYAKDGDGKHNSTHLVATAPENTTGADRKALVCCTYNAPEGYEFEGGAKSAFRQFIVTQKPNSSLKAVEFWGGIGAEYTHDYTAQNDWGLSYWVINVDGATATDWNGDSHNEQALYGGAEFKCYDYTNGVRGAEVDWVTVEYKQENGKVIDTWWLADIQENTTGAVRKAEIVCTFPDLEGYTYKDGQNVRTTIITQNPSTPAGGDQGGSEEVVEGLSYTIFNNAADGSKSTGFGPGAGSVGDWYRFENIIVDGKKYMPGQDMKDLVADPALVSRLMSQAFEFGEITEEDVQVPGADPLTANPEEFVTLEPWSDGGAAVYVRIVLSGNDSGVRRTFKIITKDGEGNKVSSVVYFQN